MGDESEQDTQSKVDSLAKQVKDYKLPAFTSSFTGLGKSKRPAPDDGGDEAGPSIRPRHDHGGATEQLETWGYTVVQDVFETDRGTWELMSKVNHFSVHDLALTIVFSYHLMSAQCIDGAIQTRQN